jgi:hypothetical protein
MPSSNFSGAFAGEKEDFFKGSLSCSTIYFVIVLLYLHHFIKNPKKLVPLVVCILLLLPLVHYVVH